MAIIINSKFRPFSYQEMLQPVFMATQAHQALEDAYSAIDAQASVWEKLKYSDIDKDVYNQYKSFSDALKAQSNQLAQSGLTPASRRAMLDMRARYSKDINPIEQAWNERDRQIKMQQQARLTDRETWFDEDARQIGLRKFMDNPTYDTLSSNYSGALLTKKTADVAEQFKTQLMDKGRMKGLGLPFQYERDLQYGFTKEQIDKAVRRDPDANPILLNVMDQVLASTPLKNWKSYEQLKPQIDSAMALGLYKAMGTTKPETFKDDYGSGLALARAKYNMEHPPVTEDGKPLIHWDGQIVSGKDLSKYQDTLGKLMGPQGKGLRPKYFAGKGVFVNPIKVYEEAKRYAEQHPSKAPVNRGTPRVGSLGTSPTVGGLAAGLSYDNSWENAVKVMEKKYGVSIINSQDYQRLKQLGYDSKSTFKEMNGTQLLDRLNDMSQAYYATSTDMGSYDQVSKRIIPNLQAAYNEDRFSGVYEYKNGKRGKALEYKDVLTGKDDEVQDVAYSALSPDDIAVKINGKNIYINPAYHSAEAANIVDTYKGLIEQSLTSKQKAYWQDRATEYLRELFNLYDPIRSTTSSKR